ACVGMINPTLICRAANMRHLVLLIIAGLPIRGDVILDPILMPGPYARLCKSCSEYFVYVLVRMECMRIALVHACYIKSIAALGLVSALLSSLNIRLMWPVRCAFSRGRRLMC